ncbi:hypothetical protein FSI29_018555 [Escherichia coli]|uniref:Lumazine-binding domain-containing protein n=1 Tax=Enterobacter asburiae TaxID=61645 RepID=A0AAW7ZRG5_ENTAS|nr:MULTISPECIES: hypothetical protein [Enterobacteriaceae]MBB9297695.1 hypothetical protein [Escherichia coli]MDD9220204.1 hypothetical protein [Enterobacter kobei]MDO7920982.1 hypothetical protein [Enterobacter asburiae]MDV0915288.1 hypothetical protein [Enterobacter asburiae]MDV0935281.1 hypothetical protein [Enterobacter asburiae]
MVKTPGFCRHIEKEWLEQTVRWVASEADSVQLNKNLEVFLGTYIATKENRRKARNLLTSIWMRPKNKDVFFETSIQLHQKIDAFSLPIHWGMLIAKKPFFAEVARFIGRQARLNDAFTFSQVFRRMSMLYGETQATSRALSAVLRTMIELGVIDRSNKPASYSVVPIQEKVSSHIANWLTTAAMISLNKVSISLDEVLADQVFFPFQIDISLNTLDVSTFEYLQQGNSIVVFKRNLYS